MISEETNGSVFKLLLEDLSNHYLQGVIRLFDVCANWVGRRETSRACHL